MVWVDLDFRWLCKQAIRTKIQCMPPAERDSVAPQERPYQFLSRDELGRTFAVACRVSLRETRPRRGTSPSAWLRHPLVRDVLAEFLARYWDEAEEASRQLAISELG